MKKNQREFDHEYIRNKQFKNELDPKYAFYDCLRSCEIKSNTEKSLEECVENCEPRLLPENFDG